MSLEGDKPTLDDKVAHELEVGEPPRDVGLYHSQHGEGGLIDAHEGAVADLTEAKQLHHLLSFGGHAVDTGGYNRSEQSKTLIPQLLNNLAT